MLTTGLNPSHIHWIRRAQIWLSETANNSPGVFHHGAQHLFSLIRHRQLGGELSVTHFLKLWRQSFRQVHHSKQIDPDGALGKRCSYEYQVPFLVKGFCQCLELQLKSFWSFQRHCHTFCQLSTVAFHLFLKWHGCLEKSLGECFNWNRFEICHSRSKVLLRLLAKC
jgi:hypothetical protein